MFNSRVSSKVLLSLVISITSFWIFSILDTCLIPTAYFSEQLHCGLIPQEFIKLSNSWLPSFGFLIFFFFWNCISHFVTIYLKWPTGFNESDFENKNVIAWWMLKKVSKFYKPLDTPQVKSIQRHTHTLYIYIYI